MKNFNKKIVAVIPTLNEEMGISQVIDSMPNPVISDIIVVDGSTDRTAEIAEKKGAIVVKETRRGYGRAYKTGFQNLPAQTDIVVCLDGDGTYPAYKIKELVNTLEQEKLDFISCSRIVDGNMSLMHKVGNTVLNLFTNVLFNFDIKDSQSGMWVFRKNILDDVKPRSDTMSFSEEFKLRTIDAGYKFKEIDVPYDKRVGQAKLRSFRDGIGNLLFLFKTRVYK